jgi:hypothetical protein
VPAIPPGIRPDAAFAKRELGLAAATEIDQIVAEAFPPR